MNPEAQAVGASARGSGLRSLRLGRLGEGAAEVIPAWVREHPGLTALILYLAVATLLELPVLAHLNSRCACGWGSDSTQYMWSMEWWPYAIVHGHQPVCDPPDLDRPQRDGSCICDDGSGAGADCLPDHRDLRSGRRLQHRRDTRARLGGLVRLPALLLHHSGTGCVDGGWIPVRVLGLRIWPDPGPHAPDGHLCHTGRGVAGPAADRWCDRQVALRPPVRAGSGRAALDLDRGLVHVRADGISHPGLRAVARGAGGSGGGSCGSFPKSWARSS